jgi:hypothetical protein
MRERKKDFVRSLSKPTENYLVSAPSRKYGKNINKYWGNGCFRTVGVNEGIILKQKSSQAQNKT